MREILHETPSGPIAIEAGAGGTYLRFECSCEDAIPYCKAACCALPGIAVTKEERKVLKKLGATFVKDEDGGWELERRSNDYCVMNDPQTRACTVYESRPETCVAFHCTRGPSMRGWKLELERR